MDIGKLSSTDITDFLSNHGVRVSYDSTADRQRFIEMYEQLTNAPSYNEAEDPARDLSLSVQVKKKFSNEPPFLLSDLLAADNTFLEQIAPYLEITFPNSDDQTPWEKLRARVVRILRFADLLIDDTFSSGSHANEWPVSFPSEFDITTGAMNDTDDITVREYFPELYEEVEQRGQDFWDVYDPDDVSTWDIRPLVIRMIREEARRQGKELKRGDIIGGGGYRNEGRYIFDGENIVELDTSVDDYGALPPEYKFPAFPLNYWYDPLSREYLIDHNEIQWIDLPQFEDELRRNLRGPIQPDQGYATFIDYQGKKYNFEVQINEDTDEFDFADGAVIYTPSGYFTFGDVY